MDSVKEELSIPKIVVSIIVVAVLAIIYYTKVLDISEGENKGVKLLKHLFVILVLVGFLSIFNTLKDTTGRFMILLIMLLIINVYNINHSISKCKVETAYEVNLLTRSSIIIVIVSLLLYYSSENDIFSMFYSDADLPITKEVSTEIVLAEPEMPDFCPDMTDSDYKTDYTWTKLTEGEKNDCHATFSEISERTDIDEDVYA